MRILVAEDEIVSRSLLEHTLKRWGYDVVSTRDGEEASRLMLAPNPPQIAILDWMMPIKDGLDVTRTIRAANQNPLAYIILLTTRATTEDIVAGLEAGANDYITKPFDRAELLARIKVGERVLELENTLAAQVRDLRDALDHIKVLQGIVPICSHCHNIRTDKQSWERIERYFEEHSEVHFSHSICPDCMAKFYPELSEQAP